MASAVICFSYLVSVAFTSPPPPRAKVWPAQTPAVITQSFGSFGGYGFKAYHTGIDIALPLNADVFAICDGRIFLNKTTNTYPTAFENYYNSFVIIKHNCNGDEVYGYYGHVYSRFREGWKVSAGQLFANVIMSKAITDTVSATGIDQPGNNHLHFGLARTYIRNQWGYAPSIRQVMLLGWINPITYLNTAD